MDYSWTFFHGTRHRVSAWKRWPGTSTQPQAATVAALVPPTATAGGAATRHGSSGSAGPGVPQIMVTLPCNMLCNMSNMSFEWEPPFSRF